ncbi:hypothetical protein Tco_1099915 [Tanacetum coccineum]
MFNRISFRETHHKVIYASLDKLLGISMSIPRKVQDLINKLVEDVQKINEDLADYVNCPGFNRELVSSYDDDDGEYSLATQEYLKTYSTEITPEEPVESLSMGGIDNINFDSEGDILFLETLLYDNSSPRPPKAVQTNYDEINLFTGSEDSIPPGIENDDFDSEDDDNSALFPEFKSFHVDYPKSGNSTIDVVEDIPVDVPNILLTHPSLQLDFDFIPSHNDLGSDLDVSSPSGDRNKIYDLGICIEVESTRFISTLSPVIDTLLPFSSKNEVKVFNHGVLASKEKSPSFSSHRGFKASKLFHHKSPMLIHGDNTPNLGVRHPHFIPLDKAQVWGDWVKLSDLKQALRGRHPMLIRSSSNK